MNDTRQPIIRYRTSIWLFSFLILVLFAVFSIGIAINVSAWGREWKRSALNNFITTSQSLELLFKNSSFAEAAISGNLDLRVLDEVEKILEPFQLNTFDRVFVVSRSIGYQIFPYLEEKSELLSFSTGNLLWKKGWEGITSVSAEYTSWDGTSVVARIVPEKFSEGGPGILLVIERNRQVFDWPDIYTRAFFFLSILGLFFAYIVVINYGRKMLKPFARLETILLDAMNMKTVVAKPEESFRDPVQRAIETFAAAIQTLRDQESRLEYLGDKLAQPMSPMDPYEDDLLASVNTGIISFDQNRVIQTMTSQIPQLVQLRSSIVRGLKCEDVFGRESEICKVLQDALDNKRGVKQHFWKYEHPEKGQIWLSISTTMIQSADGRMDGIGCVLRDVTLLKRLRGQIREKEHLAGLGELSAGIAHEFRNPLGAIQGNAENIMEEEKDEELRNIASEIYNEVKGLDRIVRNFLQFARPVYPDVSPVDLWAMIREERLSIIKQYKEGIDISLVPEDGKLLAEVDENLMRQVVRNVFLNACQAMSGKGAIVVSYLLLTEGDQSFPGKPCCIIRIQDDGPGILPAIMDDVFKPFFTGRPDGTGLGLAIVKKIILLHNGFVEFEDKTRKGSTLRITIPLQFDPDTKNLTRPDLSDDVD